MKLNHETEIETDVMVLLQDLLTRDYEVKKQQDADGNDQIYLKFEHGASWTLSELPRMFKKVLANRGVIEND